ncbi:response regulator [Carboxylicivirga sediminis]|uniref:histidine kinase n=1 Tax=Carboxylicivirga sediminis TaxID=2006564 RepID=A0A941F5S8_9BACT|nr:two-component regulator propeller domain-containing protein [Carboxylicivirga sediminis]MBR8536992.1 response regulator [Carboxylicivirga sediminis]
MKQIFLLSILLITHVLSAKESTDSLYFRNLRMKDGLPGSSISTIIQDSLDFIWIGTNDGLCRYDGENFKVFKSIPNDSASLSDNTIQNLFLDHKGNLYIMTAHGLDYFDLKLQKITRISAHDEGDLADASPTDVVETNAGDIYISSYYAGISYKKKHDKAFSYLYEDPDIETSLSSDRISCLELYEDSLLIIGYWDNGIDIFNLSDWKNQSFSAYTNEQTIPRNINTMVLDNNSGLWIGSKQGLSYLNLETRQVSNYFYNKKKPNFLPDNDVIALYIDHNENIWMGTRDGGLSIAKCSDIIQHGPAASFSGYTSSYNKGSLSYRTVLSIYQDKNQDVWVGTHGGGLNYVENRENRFSHLQHQPGISNSLSYDKVWGITEAKNGDIWLGTDGDGVNVWSSPKGLTQHFKHIENNHSSLSDDAIISACTDHQGTIWLGTYEGGINRYIPATNSFKAYKAPHDIPVNDIRCLYEDNERTLWVGLNQGGICYYNRKTDRFIQHPAITNEDVRALIKVNNTLWIGTYGNGLIGLNLINQKIKRFDVPTDVADHKSPPIIFSLYSNNAECIWMGTANSGLCRFDIQSETFHSYKTSDGLSNNKIHKILSNQPNTLWMSTNSGISQFDITSEKFINYDWNQGVQSEEFHNGSGIITNSGIFIFGGIKGVNLFNPKDFKPVQKPSNVRFTSLKVLNQDVSVESQDIIQQSIEFNPDIHLNYRHTIFTIDFQLVRYPSSADVVYQYILEGYDKTWNICGLEQSATYRNLPPGEYTFRVRSTDKAGYISDEATLQIFMTPPYWKTKIAFGVYLLLLILIVFGIFRYRVQQYKIKNRLKYEQKLRLKEGKLHDERLEFFTNISHELRTPLTIINVALEELAVLKNTYPKIRKSIDVALTNSNRLIELVNKILEFRQVETGVSKLAVSEVHLNGYLSEFLQGFREMARHNSVNLKLQLPITDVTLWVDIDKFSMILNNLLSNAFKHTPSEGSIILSVDEDEQYIELKVEDSGRGIPRNIQNKIFKRYYKLDNKSTNTGIGLALTKSLINLHHATITVESMVGKGSVFSVKFLKGNKHFTANQFSDSATAENNETKPQLKTSKIEIKDNEQVILLVDDNLEILELLSDKLKSDYKILTATDGQEGIDFAREYSPNLIISDIMMPGISGTELCNTLKADEQTSHIPIILLTAKGTSNDEIEGLNAGADDYISKPFKIAVLQARIKTILDNRIKLFNYFSTNNGGKQKPQDEPSEPDKEMEFLNRVEQYVLDKYLTSEVSVFELASELGFSRTTLYRKIKSLTGLSINAFVRSVKIKKSAELIAQGMNVSEAAFYIGFNDLKYFRESFKKQLGKNPSEFK